VPFRADPFCFSFVSDPFCFSGRMVEYFYEGELLSSVVDLLGYEMFYYYDENGVLVSKIDGSGRVTNIAYNDFGAVASVTYEDGTGKFFEYDYSEVWKEHYSRVTFSSGKVKETWFDQFGEKVQTDINGKTIEKIISDGRNEIITDAGGNQTQRQYNEWNDLISETYPDGSSVSYEYDLNFHKMTKRVDERGIVTEYEYDDSGNRVKMIEAKGTTSERITEYTYDEFGNQLTIKNLADADTPEALTTMEYDTAGNMKTLTDPEGGTTLYTYDNMGNMLTKKDAQDALWQYEYDDMGSLISTTDSLGNVTYNAYDARGNLLSTINAEDNETTYEYDSKNDLISVTDAFENVSSLFYDTEGKMTKQVDAEGKKKQYEYDLDGRPITIIDGNGNETITEYDDITSCSSCSSGAAGKPIRIVYPTYSKELEYDIRGRKIAEIDVLSDTDQLVTSYEYDSTGNIVSMADKEGNTTTYVYDELNRLIRITDPLGGVTINVYDSRNNLISLTDAEDNTTSFEYDLNNRLIKETRPMGEKTTYAYDYVGNRVQRVDAKNQKTEFDYDDAGRLVEVRYYSTSADTTPVKTIMYTYNNVNQLTGYNDGTTSATYTYDVAGRKESETINYGTFSLTYSYTYYANGKKKTFTGPDDITYEYTYDANNQPAGINIPGKGFITYNTYQWTRPTGITLPGGNSRELSYDSIMKIESMIAKDPAQNIFMDYNYTHDNVGNILNKNTEFGNYIYNYDDLYRLSDVDNPIFADEAYTYDAVGNRLTSVEVPGDWTYNENNELMSYDSVSLGYDENGNMIQGPGTSSDFTFIYDIENRLVRVENASANIIAEYYYDPLGRRLWKDVAGTRTNFLYADEGLIDEYDASGVEIKTYGYKADSMWTTDPVFMKLGTGYFYYQNDHLGTPQMLTDQSGAIVWSADYESFGEASISIAAKKNNLRFPGQYYDEETGLHYNWNRYYSPEAGRYLTPDPIGLYGEMNLYAYTNQNPVNLTDPLGLYSWGDLNRAWSNYCSGSETSWTTTFGSINWGDVRSKIRARIASMIGSASICPAATIPG